MERLRNCVSMLSGWRVNVTKSGPQLKPCLMTWWEIRGVLLLLALAMSAAGVVASPKAHASPVEIGPIPRIIGGEDADPRAWKTTVSLVSRQYFNEKRDRNLPLRSAYWGHFCTGTLLTRQVVITAGHCVWDGTWNDFEPVPTTDVVIGRNDLRAHGKGERIPVRRVMVHPGYWGYGVNSEGDTDGDGLADMGRDLALLFLARPSKRVKPLGLSRLGGLVQSGGLASVAGWGVTESARNPGRLKTVEVPLLDDSYCRELSPSIRANVPWGFVPGYQLCAGDPEVGADSCRGDSGGPLMYRGNLVGLVSFGSYRCGFLAPPEPGFYLRVDGSKGWILRQLERSSKWPNTKWKGIKEEAGWSMPRRVDWKIAPVSSSVQESHIQIDLAIFANRTIRNAQIRNVGGEALCPGEPDDYNYDYSSRRYIPSEECSTREAQVMKPAPGLQQVEWYGWVSPADGCPVVQITATVGGKAFRARFPSCDVERIAWDQFRPFSASLRGA